ncbi:RagB/SusD family nutrient uptake outer membrane protein [Flavivirga amylovorans]|uniref:RagB/SusD family nutrient uptake outer membrane protein n=1 Tax=Flavivirga amylovorans TaxID=870486 RepID=A0ABT8WW43_9FLAO|nr:RagB/SusD family nutrient uptake outer membrane protein [Flavivirga amylovorans]MDO5985827.1 RagB/SusD family nutrient uptake outer membrane protein [Flavivirga amylovorans]
MKKYMKIFAVIVFMTSFFGCDSFLEEDPKVLLTPENFYKTIGDLKAAVNSINAQMFDGAIGGRDGQNRLSVPGAARSYQMHIGADDLTTKNNGTKTQWVPIDQFNPTSVTIFIERAGWKIPYDVIYQCNNIIERKDDIEGNEDEIDQYVALAYFWRGWAYFHATRFYGDIPIIINSDINLSADIARSPVIDVYQQIESDLLEALKYLPDSWQTETAYPDAYALKTLLADFYITWAGWPIKDTSKYVTAASYAEDVMLNSGAALLPDFADLWRYDVMGTYDDHQETIFDIVFLTREQIGSNDRARAIGRQFIPPEERNGFSDFFCEVGFFNRFPEGYRKDVTFKTEHNGVPWQDFVEAHPYYKKFRGSYDYLNSRNAQSGANFMVYRYADVLLLYAEAKAMSSGPDASAYEAINKVRRRANNLPVDTPDISVDLTTGLSQIDFRDAVIDERAWEFAGEQRRWYDLVRTEKVAESVSGKDPSDVQPASVAPLLDTYLFPIPFSDIQQNPNIQQNTGY